MARTDAKQTAMHWEIELNNQKLVAAPASELSSVLALTPDAIKQGEGFACVVDLRKSQEIQDKPNARLQELGVRYVQVPVTAATFSEQDMDAVRREFARSWGQVLVVSQGGTRATFLTLAHAARVRGWSPEQAMESCPKMRPAEEQAWVDHLSCYLARHRPVPA